MIMIMDISLVRSIGGGRGGGGRDWRPLFHTTDNFLKLNLKEPTPTISKTYATCLFLQCTCQKSESSKNDYSIDMFWIRLWNRIIRLFIIDRYWKLGQNLILTQSLLVRTGWAECASSVCGPVRHTFISCVLKAKVKILSVNSFYWLMNVLSLLKIFDIRYTKLKWLDLTLNSKNLSSHGTDST